MFCFLAASTWACTSGVAFWMLNTYTWTPLVAICWSMAALSASEGSVPSLIAFRNSGEVIKLSPNVSENGEKIDSLAPTGVPAYLALMVAIRPW